MSEREFCFILIGINIGVAIGWFSCKRFKGNLENFMGWLNREKKEVIERQNKEEIIEAKDVTGVPI